MLNIRLRFHCCDSEESAIVRPSRNAAQFSSHWIRYLTISLFATACFFPPVTFAQTLERQVQAIETAEIWIKEELYFGRGLPNGSTISDEQWREFVETTISPHFPEGFSVLDVNGYYLNHREPTKLLIILHPNSLEAERSLREIINQYKEKFQQESVLRVSDRVRVQL